MQQGGPSRDRLRGHVTCRSSHGACQEPAYLSGIDMKV